MAEEPPITLVSSRRYNGPERRAESPSDIATALAEQARATALDLADRQMIREREAAEQRQKLSEKLAEDRGAEKATLRIWQIGVDDHQKDQTNKMQILADEVAKLAAQVTAMAQALAMKSANEVTVGEFRKWAVGVVLAGIGLFFSAGGHIG